MISSAKRRTYIMGLDLGTDSIGWTLIGLKRGEPNDILAMGTHCFDAGVEGNIEKGQDKSRGAARREARQPRRQHWRRAYRRAKILKLLQWAELLPPHDFAASDEIHEYFLKIDAKLRKKHGINDEDRTSHLMPYILRARALDKKLSPTELGRALYHLGQRRGFLSNRKKPERDDKEAGEVKSSISRLDKDIAGANCRTLGEYFAILNPRDRRIRQRYTSRKMYEHEFDLIVEKQARYHDVLSDDMVKRLRKAFFHQRPLKSQRQLIGKCSLMPKKRWAAAGLLIAQRFRMLQFVNNLRLTSVLGEETRLTEEQRNALISELERQGDLTFAKIRALLKLKRDVKFNYELGGEPKIPGNRTEAVLRAVFGGKWDELTDEQHEAVVNDLLSFHNTEALANRGKRVWGLDEAAAKKLAEETHLEEGYSNHCRAALEQLTREMEAGTTYAEARKKLFPDSFEAAEPLDELPPATKAVPDLRNPAVSRTLTELRKIANEIIRHYGKPEVVRIELARDLKRPRKQRQKISKDNRTREGIRVKAKARLLKEMGIAEPSRQDIEKALLLEECGGQCPYTGRTISMKSLFGENPQFDIEHILPMSRSLDNSYTNKTLCYHEENRQRKRNMTPYEAYSRDAERWDEILGRVSRFQGDLAREKLCRFRLDEMPEGFAQRQLNDTRYASRLAAEYVGLLFGGTVDGKGNRRVQVSMGGITHHLRNEWRLNGILNDGDQKTRDDHRHHAVDALVVALSSPGMVKALEEAASNARRNGRRLFTPIKLPGDITLDDVREKVEAINVSKRPNRKLNGSLHKETIYSESKDEQRGTPIHHVRKELHKLSKTNIEKGEIVDPIVRERVRGRWIELGKGKPIEVFGDPANHPFMETIDGRRTPIHKVRVLERGEKALVGKGGHKRYVASTNHHTEVTAVLNAKGEEIKWEAHQVTRLEATQRRAENLPIIQHDWGEGRKFKFSLYLNDYLLMDDDDGSRMLCRCTNITANDLEFRLHTDARVRSDARRIRKKPNVLRALNVQKVRVTHLGEIVPQND